MYVPHHRLEKDYTMNELKELGRYDIVPPEELIWLPQSVHNGNLELHKGLRECKHGSDVGVKKHWKKSTLEKHFYAKYEKLVEKLNNTREKRLRKIRFELTYNRQVSRQRKDQIVKQLSEKAENLLYKKFKKFEKLLDKQTKLKVVVGKVWLKYEEQLQKMIEVL